MKTTVRIVSRGWPAPDFVTGAQPRLFRAMGRGSGCTSNRLLLRNTGLRFTSDDSRAMKGSR